MSEFYSIRRFEVAFYSANHTKLFLSASGWIFLWNHENLVYLQLSIRTWPCSWGPTAGEVDSSLRSFKCKPRASFVLLRPRYWLNCSITPNMWEFVRSKNPFHPCCRPSITKHALTVNIPIFLSTSSFHNNINRSHKRWCHPTSTFLQCVANTSHFQCTGDPTSQCVVQGRMVCHQTFGSCMNLRST